MLRFWRIAKMTAYNFVVCFFLSSNISIMYELTTRTRLAHSLNLHEVRISRTGADELIELIQRKNLAAIKLEKLAANLGYSTKQGDFFEILKLLNENADV